MPARRAYQDIYPAAPAHTQSDGDLVCRAIRSIQVVDSRARRRHDRQGPGECPTRQLRFAPQCIDMELPEERVQFEVSPFGVHCLH